MAVCVFCLVLSMFLQVQEGDCFIIVIKIVIYEDGIVIMVKKWFFGDEDLEVYLEILIEDEGVVFVDIQVVMGEEFFGEVDDELVLFFCCVNLNDENEEIEEVCIFMNGDVGDFMKVIEECICGLYFNSCIKKVKVVKVFLGIYLGSIDDNVGVDVCGVVDGIGVQAGGIQKGDVIQLIIGYVINGIYGLSGVL